MVTKKRVLIVDECDSLLVVDREIVRKVDERRGEMSRPEFLNYLIDSRLAEDNQKQDCVSKEEFLQFARGVKELLHNFLEFFITYGLALEQPRTDSLEKLAQKLEGIGASGKPAS